jgi:XTP/dITP diphosphohydrolase
MLATLNRAKARELVALLGDVPYTIVPLCDIPGATLPEETAETYAGNALLKAHAAARYGGDLVMADDSGLEVDALDGGPGVRTRRYAGEDATDEQNNTKLLRALDGLSPDRRGARYVCVLALALPAERGPRGGQPLTVVRGTCRGRIARAPRGSGGFGYDPIFEPSSEPPGGRTLGEWSQEAKNAISHRGAAARRMTPILRRHGF